MTTIELGTELEFFIGKYKNGVLHVENADSFAKNRLGFSICQNSRYDYPSGKIILKNLMFDNTALVTDGTAFELHFLRDCSIFCFESTGFTMVGQSLDTIKTLLRLDEDHIFIFDPFLTNKDENIVFENTGSIFRSEKRCRDAYTGKSFYVEKKDDPYSLVTMRTAGLHFHFSLYDYDERLCNKVNDFIFGKNKAGTKHSDYIVRNLDELVKNLGLIQSEKSQQRMDEYQKFGTYRIKESGTRYGYPTLEYRQLDSQMLKANWWGVAKFLKESEKIILGYLKSNNVI